MPSPRVLVFVTPEVAGCVGVGIGSGAWVTDGVGLGIGIGVAEGLGVDVTTGLGDALGLGVAEGVGVGVGVVEGVGAEEPPLLTVFEDWLPEGSVPEKFRKTIGSEIAPLAIPSASPSPPSVY
jgi:hypothetical protein